VDRADCHAHIGTLVLPGKDISADIPEGVDVRITIKVDASQAVTVSAEIPLTGDRPSGRFEAEKYTSDLGESRSRKASLEKDVERIRRLHEREPIEEVARFLEVLASQDFFPGLEKELDRWEAGDIEAKKRGYQRVLELAGALCAIESVQRPARIRELIARLEPMCEEEKHVSALGVLKAEFEAAEKAANAEALASAEEAVDALDNEVRRSAFIEVLLDVFALGGLKVTPHQNQVFRDGDTLTDQIIKDGGPEAMGRDAVQRLRAMHKKFQDAYPDLYARRRDWIEANPGKDPRSHIRGDVRWK
jgi:hypothetical protein